MKTLHHTKKYKAFCYKLGLVYYGRNAAGLFRIEIPTGIEDNSLTIYNSPKRPIIRDLYIINLLAPFIILAFYLTAAIFFTVYGAFYPLLTAHWGDSTKGKIYAIPGFIFTCVGIICTIQMIINLFI